VTGPRGMKKLVLLLFLLSSGFAFGQVTYLPVTVAFPHIAVGGDPNGQNYVTLLQLVNNNSSFTTGHMAFFSDSGAPLPVLFDGQGPQSTMDVQLDSGQTRQIRLTLNGIVTAGWMEITYSPSDALTTVILQFRSGTTLLSEIGVNPAHGISATDIAAQTDAALNTGIAIANPDTVAAYVLVGLSDQATGVLLADTIVTLPPNGHTSRFLTELFPNVANIKQIRAKVSMDQCSTSACTGSGGNGFLATAVRFNGDQFTTIPVIDRPPDGDQIRIFPQVAFGGPAAGINMTTVLYLTTNESTGLVALADLFDDNGSPLAASADGAAATSSIPISVFSNRVTRVVLTGDETLRSGWMRLTLPGPVHLITSAIFQTFEGPNLVSEASVLESPQVTRGLIYVKSQPGLANIGIAFANPQPTFSTITLTLFNNAGFVSGTQVVTVPPNGHVAKYVTQIFPQLASVTDFDGALSLNGSAVSMVALRSTGDKFATLPIAANGMYRPAITAVRVSTTQRLPAQINFQVDLVDYDSDLATNASRGVSGTAEIDFGSLGYDDGPVVIDGTALVNQPLGTVSGSFQPPNVTGTVPSGTSGVFYIYVLDSAGNQSNVVGVPVKF
jgi:hypothetical protein